MGESDRHDQFGCDYCRADANRLYGHLTQVASNDDRQMILLHCPQCGALYENTARGSDCTRRLTAAEANRLYGTSFSEPWDNVPGWN
jgi:hypothetical protein